MSFPSEPFLAARANDFATNSKPGKDSSFAGIGYVINLGSQSVSQTAY